jgi:hypothetical protein
MLPVNVKNLYFLYRDQLFILTDQGEKKHTIAIYHEIKQTNINSNMDV